MSCFQDYGSEDDYMKIERPRIRPPTERPAVSMYYTVALNSWATHSWSMRDFLGRFLSTSVSYALQVLTSHEPMCQESPWKSLHQLVESGNIVSSRYGRGNSTSAQRQCDGLPLAWRKLLILRNSSSQGCSCWQNRNSITQGWGNPPSPLWLHLRL